MYSEMFVFVGIGLLLGGALWWMWRARQISEHQASLNAEFAKLGQSVREIAHDLDNLFVVVLANICAADDLKPEELRTMLADVEQAARSATRLLGAIRGAGGRRAARPGSAEGVIRLTTALLQRTGAAVELIVDGDLSYSGDDADAVRVVQNLVMNANREAATLPEGRVSAHLEPGVLRISNPVRNPALLDDDIYRRGVSHAGSSGQGLAIAREAAARLGWSIRHELRGNEVTFFIEGKPAERPRFAN